MKRASDGRYSFTLIDFGIMKKLKAKKAKEVYTKPGGNLQFCSNRGLHCEQCRYQDDYESLLYLSYNFIF